MTTDREALERAHRTVEDMAYNTTPLDEPEKSALRAVLSHSYAALRAERPRGAAPEAEAEELPRTTHEADEQVWAVHDELRKLEAQARRRPLGVLTGPGMFGTLADQLTTARWRPTPAPAGPQAEGGDGPRKRMLVVAGHLADCVDALTEHRLNGRSTLPTEHAMAGHVQELCEIGAQLPREERTSQAEGAGEAGDVRFEAVMADPGVADWGGEMTEQGTPIYHHPWDSDDGELRLWVGPHDGQLDSGWTVSLSARGLDVDLHTDPERILRWLDGVRQAITLSREEAHEGAGETAGGEPAQFVRLCVDTRHPIDPGNYRGPVHCTAHPQGHACVTAVYDRRPETTAEWSAPSGAGDEAASGSPS